jgi:Fur family transcriptional regulator, iron response regulator
MIVIGGKTFAESRPVDKIRARAAAPRAIRAKKITLTSDAASARRRAAGIRQSPNDWLESERTYGSDQAMAREDLAALLRSRGIAPTRQRMEIARVLFDGRQHLSADQILARVNARHAEASKATVYNTLRLFAGKKLIRELVVDSTKTVYDPNTAPHHHRYDVVTGQLTDIPAEGVSVVGLPPLPAGTITEGVDIIVRTRRRP